VWLAVRAESVVAPILELVRCRQLLLSLTWRDVRVRYKQSFLGIAWAVLLPVSMMLVFTFVFTRAIDARAVMDLQMPYALYAYVGLVPWTFFSLSLGGCVNSLVANRNLVTKVYFPREVFPLSCVGSSFIDFFIALIVLAALMAYFHLAGEWSFVGRPSLLIVPLLILVQVALTVGLGMLLAMANLFYRDVRQVFGVGIQLMMFVSAVVVPIPDNGSRLSALLSFNPLVPIITGYRDCIIHGRSPAFRGVAYSAVVALVVLVAGWWLFRRASYRFAERI
jgi:ABC-type polysaccharide/polyol phosphate export permease